MVGIVIIYTKIPQAESKYKTCVTQQSQKKYTFFCYSYMVVFHVLLSSLKLLIIDRFD